MSAGSFFQGTSRLNFIFLESCSMSWERHPSSLTLFQPLAWMAPSLMESAGFGMISSSANWRLKPRPSQVGQAP